MTPDDFRTVYSRMRHNLTVLTAIGEKGIALGLNGDAMVVFFGPRRPRDELLLSHFRVVDCGDGAYLDQIPWDELPREEQLRATWRDRPHGYVHGDHFRIMMHVPMATTIAENAPADVTIDAPIFKREWSRERGEWGYRIVCEGFEIEPWRPGSR